MDAKLIENGFAFIAFLTVIVVFVRQVVIILDKRLGQMIDQIDKMISGHHEDQMSMITAIATHNSACEARCDRLSTQIAEHATRVVTTHQQIKDMLGLSDMEKARDRREHARGAREENRDADSLESRSTESGDRA